jgi:hypothetical protein
MKQHAPDSCGFATTLNAIGGKWKTAILWELTESPRRFGELRRHQRKGADEPVARNGAGARRRSFGSPLPSRSHSLLHRERARGE